MSYKIRHVQYHSDFILCLVMEPRLRRSQSRTREVKCGPKFLAPAPAHSTLGWLVWHQMGTRWAIQLIHDANMYNISSLQAILLELILTVGIQM